MPKPKVVPQIIYYISTDIAGPRSEEGQSATALRKNLQERLDMEAPPIGMRDFAHETLRADIIPQEIILLAHSNTPPTTIGDRTPEQLATDLAKDFAGKDKSQLKSIILASCERGLGANPLAKQLVEALHKRGFTAVEVHAATHPQQSQIGGVVSITTRAGIKSIDGVSEGQATAIMYGNQMTADYQRFKELQKNNSRSEEENQEFVNLNKKYNAFAGFNDRHPDYSIIQIAHDLNDFKEAYNTYTINGRKAEISLDVAIALDYLNQQKNVYRKLGDFLRHTRNRYCYSAFKKELYYRTR